jgi:hypothetical protein
MNALSRLAPGLVVFALAALSGEAQTPQIIQQQPLRPQIIQQQPQGPAKIVPKMEALAETRLIMEAMIHINFRGLERKLSPQPADTQEWVYARGQALLIAEAANLLMLRPPRNQGEPIWFDRTMDLRQQATQLAQSLGQKDLTASRAGLQRLAVSCNRCHLTFRVNVEITPFQQPEAPSRKI